MLKHSDGVRTCLYSKNCPVFQTNQVSLSIPLSQSWKKKIFTDNQLCTNPKLHELLELSLSLSTNTEHGNYKTGAINSFFRKANSSYSLVTSGNHREQLCFFGLEEPKLAEWILWIFDLVSKFGVKHSQTSQNASVYIYC